MSWYVNSAFRALLAAAVAMAAYYLAGGRTIAVATAIAIAVGAFVSVVGWLQVKAYHRSRSRQGELANSSAGSSSVLPIACFVAVALLIWGLDGPGGLKAVSLIVLAYACFLLALRWRGR